MTNTAIDLNALLSSLAADDSEDLVDVHFVSERCGWGDRTTWRYCDAPEYAYMEFPKPVIRRGRMVRWRKGDIREWVKGLSGQQIKG